MLKNERQDEIYSIISTNRFVSVKELSERLYISESSIRRDLSFLEKEGFIKRTHGGAELINSVESVMPFGIRTYKNADAKKEIAKKALTLVSDGDIVFLDQTSTSYFLALEILKNKTVTVVTNNREIVNLLSNSEMTVISSGGVISKANNNCFIGKNAQRAFEEVYADTVFFSAKSLSSDGIISDFSQEEVFVRNSMFSSADKKVFMCDSSKFDTHSAYKQCSLKDVDYLISEDQRSDKFLDKFKNLHTL